MKSMLMIEHVFQITKLQILKYIDKYLLQLILSQNFFGVSHLKTKIVKP